jgi:hypothetical protein
MEVGLPEEAGGDGAPWPPSLAAVAQFNLARARSKTQMAADRDLQTEIRGRPNIRPSQRKQQINFGAPPPDASDCKELGERSLVIRHGEPREIECAAADHISEMACISHFLPTEAT